MFDRSKPLPTGGYLEQADGTAWMALFCQNMIEIAIELAMERPAYAEMAEKFVAHFLWIATAMMHAGDGTGMWDEEDGFFYDVLRRPDGSGERLKVRSMVGLLPLCAVTSFDAARCSSAIRSSRIGCRGSSKPARSCASYIHDPRGARRDAAAGWPSILDETKLRRVLARMLDEDEFLCPHGIRSLSRAHATIPTRSTSTARVTASATSRPSPTAGMFGGNSNWRGPVWMPVNALIIRALIQYHALYGDELPRGVPHRLGRS